MKIHDIEQGTDEWLKLRSGMPTASMASKLITSAGKPTTGKGLSDYANSMAADLFAGKPIDHWEGNIYTERGHEVESEARQWYALERDVDLVEVGFCTDDLELYGASPDAMVGDEGLAEIKCLPKGHMDAILYWKKNGKAPTTYLAQIHMQMLVCDRKWCDLIYYHRDLPKIIIRIDRDAEMDKALLTEITKCRLMRDDVIKQLESIGEAA